jgi:hypothetical protein
MACPAKLKFRFELSITASDSKSHRSSGEWIQVPPSVVVHDAGNPVGEAIVWWNVIVIDEDHAGIFIRCFVPGDGS